MLVLTLNIRLNTFVEGELQLQRCDDKISPEATDSLAGQDERHPDLRIIVALEKNHLEQLHCANTRKIAISPRTGVSDYSKHTFKRVSEARCHYIEKLPLGRNDEHLSNFE